MTSWPQLSQRHRKQSGYSSKLTVFSEFRTAPADGRATPRAVRRMLEATVLDTSRRPPNSVHVLAVQARVCLGEGGARFGERQYAAPFARSSSSSTSTHVPQIHAPASLTCAGNRMNWR